MNTDVLYNKISQLPNDLKSEVEDFIDFLVLKAERKEQHAKPLFGSGKGMFVMKQDFDEPSEDFKEYMY